MDVKIAVCDHHPNLEPMADPSSCERCGAHHDPALLRRVERVNRIRLLRTDGGWSRPKSATLRLRDGVLKGRVLQVSPRYIFELKTPFVCVACYQALSEVEALEDHGHKRILMAILLVAAGLGLAGLFIPGFAPAVADLASGEKARPITVDFPPYKPPFAHTPSPPDPR